MKVNLRGVLLSVFIFCLGLSVQAQDMNPVRSSKGSALIQQREGGLLIPQNLLDKLQIEQRDAEQNTAGVPSNGTGYILVYPTDAYGGCPANISCQATPDCNLSNGSCVCYCPPSGGGGGGGGNTRINLTNTN